MVMDDRASIKIPNKCMDLESSGPSSSIPHSHTPQEQQDEYPDHIWIVGVVARRDSAGQLGEQKDLTNV